MSTFENSALDLVDHATVEFLNSILSTGERNKAIVRMLRSHITAMNTTEKDLYMVHRQAVHELLQIMESLADDDIRYSKNQLNIKEN